MNDPDYVLVGGGTAGSVLAARLSEDPAITVVLLEAGAAEGPEQMGDPTAAFQLWGSSADWSFTTTPQSGTDGLIHPWPSGKVLGGSSGINQMLHMRGHQTSYDAWEALGAKDWNYESLLPFLKRTERAEGRDTRFRGIAGPMIIEAIHPPGPLLQAWFDAAVEAGHAVTDDGNGEVTEGVAWTEMNIVDGRRQSAADAYLGPARDRPNLSVITNAQVRRLLLDGGKHCYGVEYVSDGDLHSVRSEREVILTAGTVGSAHLLMLSGIGPAEHLHEADIDVQADIAGVGSNLHDHVICGVSYSADQPVPLGGPFTNLPRVLCRSAPEANPDLQLILAPITWGPRWTPSPTPGYSVAFAAMNPASRGSVRLNTADPAGAPRIDPAYLSDERDLEAMMSGLHLAREVGESAALAAWRQEEITPGPTARDPRSLREFARGNATTYFHAVGTCRIGVDDLAVVDPTLRVHGVKGLRVADASIMPSIVSANTHATVLAIAERAAHLLRSSDV